MDVDRDDYINEINQLLTNIGLQEVANFGLLNGNEIWAKSLLPLIKEELRHVYKAMQQAITDLEALGPHQRAKQEVAASLRAALPECLRRPWPEEENQ